jgi:hypothetical protein
MLMEPLSPIPLPAYPPLLPSTPPPEPLPGLLPLPSPVPLWSLDSHGQWEYFQSVRSLSEDVFKLAKDAFYLQKFHRYTPRSVKKPLVSMYFYSVSSFLLDFAKEAITADF